FFQAEDGIRDFHVTGVQTCALPICKEDITLARNYFPVGARSTIAQNETFLIVDESKIENLPTETVTRSFNEDGTPAERAGLCIQIGRASCREREEKSEEGR